MKKYKLRFVGMKMEYIFEDVLEIKNGKNQKSVENPDGKYPIYGSGGVMGFADDYICNPDTVIIGRKGSINNPIFVEEAFWNVDTAFGLQAKKELLNPRYLFYFCKRFDFEKLNKTVTIPSLTKSDLLKIKIDLPDKAIQENVVRNLVKLEHVMRLRKEEIDKLDELIKARFVELFGMPFDNEKWDVSELRDLSESMIDGSNVDPDYYESEGDVLFLRIQNVWRNEFRLDDSVYITQEINHKHYYDTSLRKGDLLITKIGRFYTKDSSLGRVSVYRGENDCANYSNNIIRVRLIDSMNSEFVNTLLNLDDYQSFIKRTSKGGTDKRALSKSLIGGYPIIMPPKELQDEFVLFVRQVDKSKFAVQKLLDETQKLFDSLMQNYFG